MQQADNNDDVKIMPSTVIKPLHKIISDHKDVVKIVIQLNSIVSTYKVEVQEVLGEFVKYAELWNKVCIQDR